MEKIGMKVQNTPPCHAETRSKSTRDLTWSSGIFLPHLQFYLYLGDKQKSAASRVLFGDFSFNLIIEVFFP